MPDGGTWTSRPGALATRKATPRTPPGAWSASRAPGRTVVDERPPSRRRSAARRRTPAAADAGPRCPPRRALAVGRQFATRLLRRGGIERGDVLARDEVQRRAHQRRLDHRPIDERRLEGRDREPVDARPQRDVRRVRVLGLEPGRGGRRPRRRTIGGALEQGLSQERRPVQLAERQRRAAGGRRARRHQTGGSQPSGASRKVVELEGRGDDAADERPRAERARRLPGVRRDDGLRSVAGEDVPADPVPDDDASPSAQTESSSGSPAA